MYRTFWSAKLIGFFTFTQGPQDARGKPHTNTAMKCNSNVANATGEKSQLRQRRVR